MKTGTKLKAIIFDMDGVLVDSTKPTNDAKRIVWKKYGVDYDKQNLKRFLGRSLRDEIQLIKEDNNIIEEIDILTFSKEAFEMALDLMKDDLAPDANLLSLFAKAKSEGIKLAVATGSMRYRAEKLLELKGVLDKIDVFVAAGDVEKHKPAPDLFLKAAERLGVEPACCVVVEDAVNGIIAAKRAGMKAAGFLTEYFTKEELVDAGADMILDSFIDADLNKMRKIF